MELAKFTTIINAFKQYEENKSPYWYTIEFETIDQPNRLQSWTGGVRSTGIDYFTSAMNNLQKMQNCLKIYITVYSGKTGKRQLMSETFQIRDPHQIPYYPQQIPPQINNESKKNESTQQNQPQSQSNAFSGIDLLGAIFGQPGLNGADVLPNLLNVRDKMIVSEFERKDLEKTIAQLQLSEKLLQERVNILEKEKEETEAENDDLYEQTEILQSKIKELEKYIPENSPIGLSITALGSSIMTNFVKKIVSNNPEGIARMLGTDSATLSGLFETKPLSQAQPEPVREVKSVVVELSDEDLSPERKEELNVINAITEFLKGLDRDNLSAVQQIFFIWAKNIDTISQMYQWATGGRIGSDNQD